MTDTAFTPLSVELSPQLADFIFKNRQRTGADILLHPEKWMSAQEAHMAALQIDARRRCIHKLPTFLTNPDFIFPSLLSAEQATNEEVARFHASLIRPGESVADLTAGLGIDSMCMAMAGAHVTAFELNPQTNAVLRHNVATMQTDVHVKDVCHSIEWLNEHKECKFDAIYIDPARRDVNLKRTFAFSDCQPDVTACLPLLFDHAHRIIIKASPMLDLTRVVHELSQIDHMYTVVCGGECKEVLVTLHKGIDRPHKRTSVSIDKSGHANIYNCPQESLHPTSFVSTLPEAGMYLYEPDAGIMKWGEQASLTQYFEGLRKGDPNTNLYFSHELFNTFPGRRLRIESQVSVKDKRMLRGKMNVASRNHPLSAPEIYKRCRITPSNDGMWLYACRVKGKPVMYLCTEIR